MHHLCCYENAIVLHLFILSRPAVPDELGPNEFALLIRPAGRRVRTSVPEQASVVIMQLISSLTRAAGRRVHSPALEQASVATNVKPDTGRGPEGPLPCSRARLLQLMSSLTRPAGRRVHFPALEQDCLHYKDCLLFTL